MIIYLIAGNVLAIVLESIPAVHEALATEFAVFELFSVAVFSVEYTLRIWSCVEAEQWKHGWRGRLRWARQPMALVDLAAILPFYMSAIFGRRPAFSADPEIAAGAQAHPLLARPQNVDECLSGRIESLRNGVDAARDGPS